MIRFQTQLALSVTLAAMASFGCQQDDETFGCGHGPVVQEQNHALAVAGRWAIPDEVMEAGSTSRVPITSAGSWEGTSSCSGTFTEGARRVQAWIMTQWPQVQSIGGYSCRSINGNNRITSIHAVGRALDIMLPLDNGQADNALGDPIANFFVQHAAEFGVQRVIWDRTYWRSGDAPREGYYDGAHPHHDHIHLELSVDAGNLRTPFFENGEQITAEVTCADPLARDGGVVDDGGPCFSLYGPARFWRSVGDAGHGGHLYWTNAFQNDSASNWARWRFQVSADGEYDVATHTVAAYSLFATPAYRIRHAGGETTAHPQVAGVTGWTSLGRYQFVAGDSYFVDVFDHGPDAVPQGQHITADAIRITVIPPPEQGGVEEEPGPMEPPSSPPAGEGDGSEDPPPLPEEEQPRTPPSPPGPENVEPDDQTGEELGAKPPPRAEGEVFEAPGEDPSIEMNTAAVSGQGSCTQMDVTASTSWVFLVLCIALMRLRRREHTERVPSESPPRD